MFVCECCGKEYKFTSGLIKHKERCDKNGGGGGGAVAAAIVAPVIDDTVTDNAEDDITKSTFFTFPLTQLKPTANFSKEDLEMLEKRKQAKLKAIQQSRLEEKQRANSGGKSVIANGMKYTLQHNVSYDEAGNKHDNDAVHESSGNDEHHNAVFNIKYVRQPCSQNGANVIPNDAIGKSSGGGGGGGGGESAEGGLHSHAPRTISIIDNSDEMEESERILTLEKMTYLVLALIQQNTKLQKENSLLKTIISKIDPSKLE